MRTTSQEKIDHYERLGLWDNRTLMQAFDAAVTGTPDRAALIDPPNRAALGFGTPLSLTYRTLDRQVERLMARFHAAGLRQGDIVVLQMPNFVEIVIAYLALARLGVIISPVAMQYGRHELSGIAEILEPAAYISIASFKGAPYMAPHAQAFPGTVRRLAFGPQDGSALDFIDSLPTDGKAADAAKAYAANLSHSPHDIFTICWTSGTTGTPKGVPRSHNHWFCIAAGTRYAARLRDGDCMVCPFPFINMASVGGFLFNWLACRGTLVLHHPLDLPVFLGQMQDHKATYSIVPPALLNMLLKDEALLQRFDLSALRVIGSGGAPISPWAIQAFRDRLGVDIINMFGSNEGMSLVSDMENTPEPEKRANLFPRFGGRGLSWANPVAAGIETKLADPDTGAEITTPGVPGELVIAGTTVFDGYFKSAASQSSVFTADGFFRSGDLFEIDRDDPRYYRFLGRCKDIIIRGGMKISPDEIDQLLLAHPKIADAAVIGVADDIMGERICAVVVPRANETVTLDDITAYLRDKDIALFKLPERLETVEALPRNALGKILRRDLKDSLRR